MNKGKGRNRDFELVETGFTIPLMVFKIKLVRSGNNKYDMKTQELDLESLKV